MAAKDFDKILKSKWRLKLYFLRQLPMAFFAGLRVDKITEDEAHVSIPFKYLNKNPFHSMYFASLSMAAELSTGVIAMRYVSKAPVPVSMLVYQMDAQFKKKAKTRITFICKDSQAIKKTIDESIETKQGRIITVTTTGYDQQGQEVAVFHFTWTFKPKTKH